MVQTHKSIRYRLDEIDEVARSLANVLNGCRIITFEGPLGAGKTTLIRALLRELGLQEVVPSPTFTYVNIFRLPHEKTIYHFDLYRISSLDAFIATGFEEYLYDENSWVLIEWPEVIKPLLMQLPTCWISLEHISPQERLLHFLGKAQPT